MKFADLEKFISKTMRMTHVYQPLMLKTLLESADNRATVEQIARSFLNEDDSQLNYYKAIVKRWPHTTLKKHSIIRYERGTYTLLLDERVSDVQRQQLIELCDLRLQKFVEGDPWIKKFRELDHKTISGSIRYDVYKKSQGRCAACGVSSMERPLDIDHIIPRSWGGRTELQNLQALCISCNRAKSNRDDTDFIMLKKRMTYGKSSCRLCDHSKVIMGNRLACAMHDPDDRRRVFILPRRHVGALSEMIPAERTLCFDLVGRMQDHADFESEMKLESGPDIPHCFVRATSKKR